MPLSKVLHFYPAFLFAYFNCVIVLSNLYFVPQSKAGVPNLLFTMHLFSISTDKHVTLRHFDR